MSEESKGGGETGGQVSSTSSTSSSSSSSVVPPPRLKEGEGANNLHLHEPLIEEKKRQDSGNKVPFSTGRQESVELPQWSPMGMTTSVGEGGAFTWWEEFSYQTRHLLDLGAEAISPYNRKLVLALAGACLVLGLAMNFLGGNSSPDNSQNNSPQVLHSPSSSSSSWKLPFSAPKNIRQILEEKSRRARMKSSSSLSSLQPIATTFEIFKDHHVEFIISQVEEEALRHKPQTLENGGSSSSNDPFGEGQRDPLLTVMDIGKDHVLMLNKFPTMTNHMLLVTKEFQPQEGLLTGQDLHALWQLVTTIPAVGFFNSGPDAGASQSHRHLQAVPLDVLQQYNPSSKYAIPTDRIIHEALPSSPTQVSFTLPSLPFPHRLFRLPPNPDQVQLEGIYHRLLTRIGRQGGQGGDYNLVLTDRYLLAIPRSRRIYLGIDVNGMGFLGALLARGQETKEVIERVGPFNILKGVVGR